MERKQSIVAAGIVSGGLLVASAAYALTAGFLGNDTGDGAGTLDPVVATSVLPPSTTTTLAPSATSSTAAEYVDDHGGDRRAPADDERYEGRDDDD